MITGTINADTFRRALLAVLHAAHRDDVKHNKHKGVYFLNNAGRLIIFALNGKRLASVSFATPPGVGGECMAFSPENCGEIITKTTEGDTITLCDVGGQLLINCGASTMFLKPDDERFTFEQYQKSIDPKPIDSEPVTISAQYLRDLDRSARALDIDGVTMATRGAGNAVSFHSQGPRFEFLFVCMAQREATA